MMMLRVDLKQNKSLRNRAEVMEFINPKGYLQPLEDKSLKDYTASLYLFLLFCLVAREFEINIGLRGSADSLLLVSTQPSIQNLQNFIISLLDPLPNDVDHPFSSYIQVFSRTEEGNFESIEKIRHLTVHMIYCFRLSVYSQIQDATYPAPERETLLARIKWKLVSIAIVISSLKKKKKDFNKKTKKKDQIARFLGSLISLL